jgi:hypothetical protein
MDLLPNTPTFHSQLKVVKKIKKNLTFQQKLHYFGTQWGKVVEISKLGIKICSVVHFYIH